METVGKPPADVELHLLTNWGDPAGRARTGRAAVMSVLVHIAAIVFIVAVPESIMQPPARRRMETVVTPLIEPLSLLTQKEPNTAMKHYTHAARRGAKRFDSQGAVEGVAHVAFVNPNGAKTVVLSNTGAARRIQLHLGDLRTEISLPQNSVTNLNWV